MWSLNRNTAHVNVVSISLLKFFHSAVRDAFWFQYNLTGTSNDKHFCQKPGFSKQHGTSRFSVSWTASQSAPASIDCNRTLKPWMAKLNISVEGEKKNNRTDCKRALLHPSHTMWHAMNLKDCSYCSICRFNDVLGGGGHCWVSSAGPPWRKQASILELGQILRNREEMRSISIWLMLICPPFATMLESQINTNQQHSPGSPLSDLRQEMCQTLSPQSSSLPAKCVPKVNWVGETEVCPHNKCFSSMGSGGGEYTMIIESIMVTNRMLNLSVKYSPAH